MAQRAIRFSEATDKGIREAVKKRRFSSPTAFIWGIRGKVNAIPG